MPATQPQIDYIEILCNDVGFDTRLKRNDFISNLLGREVKFLDDLAVSEASQVIAKLKDIKAGKVEALKSELEPDDWND